MLTPLVVTRPQPETALWVQQLREAGVAAIAVPTMVIAPSLNPAAVAATDVALQKLHSYQAIMFVSGNAVRFFFALLRKYAMTVQEHTTFWSPGPGTSKALVVEQIPPLSIIQPASNALQFDSESLWEQAQHHIQTGHKVLIVRGGDGSNSTGHGRQWLTQKLQQRGVAVDFAPVYERQPPAITPAFIQSLERLRAQQSLWLFSSSECVQHLVQSNPAWDWQAHTALATHPRIAQQAREAGFGNVIQTLPTVQSIAASIKSLHDLS